LNSTNTLKNSQIALRNAFACQVDKHRFRRWVILDMNHCRILVPDHAEPQMDPLSRSVLKQTGFLFKRGIMFGIFMYKLTTHDFVDLLADLRTLISDGNCFLVQFEDVASAFVVAEEKRRRLAQH
jgi:hypothetical protein